MWQYAFMTAVLFHHGIPEPRHLYTCIADPNTEQVTSDGSDAHLPVSLQAGLPGRRIHGHSACGPLQSSPPINTGQSE